MNEKDIEELLKHKNDYDVYCNTNVYRPYTMSLEDWELIENLLKENEELRKNSVPVAKIKEKIKELEKEEKQQLKGTKGQDRYAIKQEFMYKRNILQELLEGK